LPKTFSYEEIREWGISDAYMPELRVF